MLTGTAVGSENKIGCAWAAAVAITVFLWQQGPRCGRGDAVQLLAGFLCLSLKKRTDTGSRRGPTAPPAQRASGISLATGGVLLLRNMAA